MVGPAEHAPVAGDIPVIEIDGAPALDLREVLTPPKPLVAIVELIERERVGDRVVLRMARNPVNLYPELVERGWTWTTEERAGGEWRLTLTRAGTAGAA